MDRLDFNELLDDLLRDLDVHSEKSSADEKDMMDLVFIVSTVAEEQQNE